MKMALKYSAIFWISFITLVLYSCSHPVHAADKAVVFECAGERINISQHNKNPLILSINRVKGTWMQIITDKPSAVTTFYNLDSGEVARIGKNYAGQYYVQLYKDADYANAHQPKRTLPCRLS